MPSSALSLARYPKAGAVGGRLIREVIAFLRAQGVSLPLTSHILIATSGGLDSVALAHLMIHFGRKILSPSQISLLHINHQWRGKASDEDEAFVRALGSRWKVSVISRRLTPPSAKTRHSWEAVAREGRQTVYCEEAARFGEADVMTAHHADDLAETVLWRLCTGASQTHGGGILFQSGVEIRPLLTIRKTQLREYLLEVGESFHEDETNSSPRFLRAQMRAALMPELERLFSRAVEHLGDLARAAQAERGTKGECKDELSAPLFLLRAAGLKARRSHFDLISQKRVAKNSGCRQIQLPKGWKLTHSEEKLDQGRERWILEQI